MNGSTPALIAVGQSLKSVIDNRDSARFREYLEGGPLPALGGDLDPAEIIRRALVQIGAAPELIRETARLLAAVISKEVETVRAGQPIHPDRIDLLMNCLYLAVDLPTDEQLFLALKSLLHLLREAGQEAENDLEFPLFRAFVHQQTDSSLESEWLAILEPIDEPWTPARKTWLLTAWRGLLWIPPDEEKLRVGTIVDFDRIECGLLAFWAATQNQESGEKLLRLALSNLIETYPRSTEFWSQHLGVKATGWPERLKEIISEMWRVQVPAETTVDQTAEQEWHQELERLNQRFDELAKEAAEVGRRIRREGDRHEVVEVALKGIRQTLELIQPTESFEQSQSDLEVLIQTLRKAG